MSTLAPSRPATDGSGSPAPEPAEHGRFAQWRSSWAVALRMARRDVRRHRGRSALVVVMVLLPTLLLSTVVTLAYTSDVTGAERIPQTMGTGQALLEWPDTARTVQLPDPSAGFSSVEQDAQPVPGFDREASIFANEDAVARLVGSPVTPFERWSARTTLGERRLSLDGLSLDGSVGLGEKLELTSGRWPAAPSTDPATPAEVLVTPVAIDRGVPGRGSFELTVEGQTRTVTVVGVARAQDLYSQPALVTAAPLVPARSVGNGGWIVLGTDPVTWPEVRTLGEYGFRVTSADALQNPPAASAYPVELQAQAGDESQRTGLMVGLAAVMLLVSTTLLVGPAFAVSATRQRRTLALAASNGAHTPVLRRTVLAQALVLGAVSAVSGVGLGVLGAWLVRAATADQAYPPFGGPFDVRWGMLAGVALCAVASTFVAALVPARRLGRLDIVGVMRGQSVSPRPSLVVLGIGVVLTAVGGALTLGGTGVVDLSGMTGNLFVGSGETLVVVGAFVLIVGSLLLVPVALAGVGRLGTHLPTSLRMAARDLARHRARSAPSVAAVLAVVAGLTFGLTGLESDTEQRRAEYLPVTIPGEVVVSPFSEVPLTAEALRSAAPGAVVTPNPVYVGDTQQMQEVPPTEPYDARFVSVVPAGCEVADTLGWLSSSAKGLQCSVAGSLANGSGVVLALPADELVRRTGLSGAAAERVRQGAVVLLGDRDGTGDTVRVVQGTYRVDPQAEVIEAPRVRVTSDAQVPAVRLPLTRDSAGRVLGASMVVAAGTPLTQGWDTTTPSWTVREADGRAVPDATVDALSERLGDEVGVQREDGFQREDRVVVAVLLGVFALLILVVVLTSTALTLAEQQTDQATLAALGATRGTRRVMAAAEAFVLAAVGCVLGVAVGLVPGIAIARPLTASGWDPLTQASRDGQSVLVIPWADLATVGLLVPVVAALLAAAGIRRAPQVTRRST
ncbi:ABC transporter permease [Arthrobacter sp. NEB 688]|uniref:ABC transporter permease n=1 Tax=Arthrobacter sp. NEB 688 TaxID=904039 RepID=UPI00156375EE|nr:ABC transporter permease [Arthrobacter sp. NEB 688]QKE83432.1 ABC transporter permease [Arthrobacter sp. NEB 688]